MVSSFGDDSPANRIPSAQLLATMQFTLKGTPFVYQGDELGMTNYPFKGIEDFNDIAVINGWRNYVLTGQINGDLFLANMRRTSRDNARTPMQWDSSTNGGFTTSSKPWLAVNPNFSQINAAQETADPHSVYRYYQRMIALRKNTPALIYGDYRDLDSANAPTNPTIFAYTRTLGSASYLIVLNFSGNSTEYSLPAGNKATKLILSNRDSHEQKSANLHLQPWEARIYKQ
jgi:oligo-1,6-glucosidase